MLENPRPYDVTTLFSVRNGCDDCQSVHAKLTGVQYSYRQADKPAFFAVVYHASDDATRKVFEEHNIRTVPYICTSK